MHKSDISFSDSNVAVVHIVDDDMGIRDALRRVLRRAGYKVRTHSSATSFLEAYDGQPGCLILDLAMPKMRGEALLDEIVKRNLNLVVLVLTGHATIRSAVRVTQLGAIDVLEKPVDNELLLAKLREMLNLGRKSFARHALAKDFKCRFDLLTHREKQVIELLLAGLTSFEIGQRLGNSKKTIDIHRGRIMRKMEAASVTELIMEWTLLSGDRF